MTEQAPTPKEVLVKLIKSFVSAEVSGDDLLRQFAQQNLANMLNQYDLVKIPAEEPAEQPEPAAV
jgi:hypothetical protein